MSPPFESKIRDFARRLFAQLPQVGQAGEASPAERVASQGTIAPHVGAYYHKVSSGPSADNRGITGTGTLPNVRTDPNRTFMGPGGVNDWMSGPLDRPSVYMGGNARGHELDAGLSWSRRYDESGQPTFTDRAGSSDGGDPAHRFTKRGGVVRDGHGDVVTDQRVIDSLQPNFAFRAFWRTTNRDEGNQWHNADKADPNQYFYPGQKVSMSIATDPAHRNQVRMQISADGQTFDQTFRQQGFGEDAAQAFKRVNSIDQFDIINGERVSLEKAPDKTVRPTRAQALDGGWDEVSIIRANGSTKPLMPKATTILHGRDVDPNSFQVDPTRSNAAGGEYVDIIPIKAY